MVTNSDDISDFIVEQIKNRWANFDRGVLIAAHRANENLETLVEIDALVNAQTLSREMRVGSMRTGLSVLSVHAKLGNPTAREFQTLVHNKDAFGHLNVVQGCIWAMSGLSERDAAILSAHTLCIGLLGAALRLGILGHIEAQAILTKVHPGIHGVIETPPLSSDEWNAFTPMSEIAVMRHETADSRLFAN